MEQLTMALFRKKLLGSAIIIAMAGGISSAIADDMESQTDQSESSMMHNMQNMMSDSFFADGKVMLGTKNYFRSTVDKNDSKDQDNAQDFIKRDAHAWTQAFMADIQSGWFMNWVGVDLSLYYNQKLDNSFRQKNENPNNVTRKNAAIRLVELLPVDRKNKANSYSKIGYNAKVNLMDYGVLKYGRMAYDTPLFSSENEFATPSLHEGFYGDVHWKGLKGYAGYVTKHNFSAASGFRKFSISDDGKIKNRAFKLYGAEYTIDQLMDDDKLTLRGQQTYQRDFEKNNYADVTYKLPSMDMNIGKFTLGAQYGDTTEKGHRKTTSKANNYKSSLHWNGAKVMWEMDKINAGFGYVKVNGRRDKNGADANLQVSVKDKRAIVNNSFVGYTAGTVNDFAFAGTRSTRFDAGYDCSDFVQGLKVKAGYTWGSINYSVAKNHKVSEADISLHYDIPFVKNLSAVVKHGYYKDKYYSDDKTQKLRKHNKDTRLMVNYTVPI